MTNQEFLTRFYLYYDNAATLSRPGFEPTEVSIFATTAQEFLVNHYYDKYMNPTKKGFEENEKRIQELGNLVATKSISPMTHTTSNVTNGVYVTLPNTLAVSPTDFSDVLWYPIYEEVTTNDTCNITKDVIEISHNELKTLISDPFNKPSSRKILRLRVSSDLHELITDGTYKVTSYKIRYIKKPTPIDLTGAGSTRVSLLSDMIHEKLVKLTVIMAANPVQAYDKMKAELELNSTVIE